MPYRPKSRGAVLAIVGLPFAVHDDVLAMRAACGLFLCVIAALLVWFYAHQAEVMSFRWSLRTLIMFVTAIALGLAVGLVLARQIAGDAIKPPNESATQS